MNDTKDLFVPGSVALSLSEIGFEEACLVKDNGLPLPTYDQAIHWLLSKYRISVWMQPFGRKKAYYWILYYCDLDVEIEVTAGAWTVERTKICHEDDYNLARINLIEYAIEYIIKHKKHITNT